MIAFVELGLAILGLAGDQAVVIDDELLPNPELAAVIAGQAEGVFAGCLDPQHGIDLDIEIPLAITERRTPREVDGGSDRMEVGVLALCECGDALIGLCQVEDLEADAGLGLVRHGRAGLHGKQG